MPKEPSFENAIAFAAELIRIPGLSGRERDVAQRVLEEMQALGFSDGRADEVGNVLGVTPGLGKAPPVLLNCHLDVVDEVFAVHIEKVYGHLASNHLDLSFKAKIAEFLDRRHPFGLDSILHH